MADRIVKEWVNHHEWIEHRSNERLKGYDIFDGLLWEHRRKACMRVARNMLRLMGEEDMEECADRSDEMVWDLKREWIADGRLGPLEVEKKGWAWVSWGEY